MSATYEDLSLTAFPEDLDTFTTWLNVTAKDGPLIQQYLTAMNAGNQTLANQILTQIPSASQKIIKATDLNKMSQAILAVERFYKTDIQPYVQTQQESWLNTINQFSYKGVWQSGTSYVTNNLVSYTVSGTNLLFIALSDVPTGISPVNQSYWRVLTIQGQTGESGTGLSYRKTWNSSRIYYENDSVTYNGNLWMSLQQNQNEEPNTNSQYWKLIMNLGPAVYPIQDSVPSDIPIGGLWFNTSNNLFNISFSFSTIQSTIFGANIQEITQIFTPTAFEYYGGWWWLAGNASNGTTMWARSNNLQIWTVVNLNASYPVMGIGFSGDLDYLWIWSNKNASSNRFVIRIQNPTTFTSGSYSFWTNSTYSFTDACSYNGSIWAVTNTKDTYYVRDSDPNILYGPIAHASITQNYYKCTEYNGYPVAISNSGYYTYKSSFTSPYVAGEYQIDSGITALDVNQMGNYLCVIATKSDGTYLYFSNGIPGSIEWNNIKISNSVVIPIGMNYFNGMFIISYYENNVLKLWVSNTLTPTSTDMCISGLQIDNIQGELKFIGNNTSNLVSILQNNNIVNALYL